MSQTLCKDYLIESSQSSCEGGINIITMIIIIPISQMEKPKFKEVE